jgi:hypothetical protein
MTWSLEALRVWGVIASASVMAVALVFAWRAPAPVSAAQAQASPSEAAGVSFLVRFRGGGPIARAQRLAAAGDEVGAARAVAAQLARQGEFQGLCFDRFTAGAAEIVLRSCAPVAAAGRAEYTARWLRRLDAMAAIEYADANLEAAPEAATR